MILVNWLGFPDLIAFSMFAQTLGILAHGNVTVGHLLMGLRVGVRVGLRVGLAVGLRVGLRVRLRLGTLDLRVRTRLGVRCTRSVFKSSVASSSFVKSFLAS